MFNCYFCGKMNSERRNKNRTFIYCECNFIKIYCEDSSGFQIILCSGDLHMKYIDHDGIIQFFYSDTSIHKNFVQISSHYFFRKFEEMILDKEKSWNLELLRS
jgi:hypothetical protein